MKNKNKNRITSSRGSATVEACISFMGFLFVIYTILNVVNYCRAQMLISNAVDTTTKELTQYSYFYKMSGLQKFSDRLADKSKIGSNNLNDVVSTLDNLYTSVNKATGDTQGQMKNVQNALEEGNFDQDVYKNALQNVANDGSNIVNSMGAVDTAFNKVMDNPMMYLKSLVAIAGNESLNAMKSHLIAAPLSKAFMVKHFGDTREEANEELKRLGVVDGLDGMNFNLSTIFASDSPNEVHIVVLYKLKLLQLFEWAELELPVCKESCAIAWLGGDNVQTKVEAPMIPADDNSVLEKNTEEKEHEEENPEETPEEETKPEPVDYTNSLWTPDQQLASKNKVDKLMEMMENDYNVTSLSGEGYGNLYSRNDGIKNSVYAYIDCTDSKHFYTSLDSTLMNLKRYADDSDNGFDIKTGELKIVVYVPDNLPDGEESNIKKAIEDDFKNIHQNIIDPLNEIDAQHYSGYADVRRMGIEVKPAGGAYDYGAGK